VDDLADACVHLLGLEDLPDYLNVGTGESVTIKRLAETVQAAAGHRGRIQWDTTRPDGFPEKTMDVRRLTALGWSPKTSLEDGIRRTVEWFRQSLPSAR
jgi:GDP-L-fucose synthase